MEKEIVFSNYESPEVEMIEVLVEKGFTTSGTGGTGEGSDVDDGHWD